MGNKYKEEYLKNKKAIVECLTDAIELMDNLGYEDKKSVLVKQKENVEKGEFTIVVVGEFSAGKSTFLNALMGKKLLPSFTSETTATINFLRHKSCAKNGEEGCVYYKEGEPQILPIADAKTIAKFVSTRGDDVVNKVDHLDLFKDSKFLEDNVTLVDSPGLNGVASGHAEITKEQIQKSSACIFMFSARQPGSKTDFQVLAELSGRVNSIICVLNQIDAIKASEGETVESVIKKLKENYKKEMGDKVSSIPEIIPISAQQALIGRDKDMPVINDFDEEELPSDDERKKYEEISRIKEFEDRLFRYLTQGQKTKDLLETPLKQLSSILCEVRDEYEQNMEVLDGKIDEEELQEKLLELQDASEKLQNDMKNKRKEISDRLKENKDELIDYVKAEAEHLEMVLTNRIEDWQELEDLDPDGIKNKLIRGLQKIAEGAEETFIQNNGEVIDEYINEAVDEIKADFSLDVSNVEIDELHITSLGIEEHQQQIKEMKEREMQLRKKAEECEDDYYAKMEVEEQREELRNQIEKKQEDLERYEELSQTAMPSVRTGVRKEKRCVGQKSYLLGLITRDIIKDVDVPYHDSTERDQYIVARNERIKKREDKIASLEEQMEGLQKGNVREIQRVQKKIDAELDALSEARQALNQEFREKNEEKIKRDMKKNRELIKDNIEEYIRVAIKQIKEQYKKNERILGDVIADRVVAVMRKNLENMEERIKKMQADFAKAEEDKVAKTQEIAEKLEKTNQMIEKTQQLTDTIMKIPVDVIQTEGLED